MRVSSRALNFALKTTLMDKNRKNDIFHILSVGDILRYYGYDENIISAGYLHEVVENGSYSVNELAQIFNGQITSYLLTTALPYDDLTTDIKLKQYKILLENLPDNNKAIICADLITDIILNDNLSYDDLQFYLNVFEYIKTNYYSEILGRLFLEINYRINNITSELEQENESAINSLKALKESLKSKDDYIICFNYQRKNISFDEVIELFENPEVLKLKSSEETTFIKDKKNLPEYEKNLLIASALESNLMSEIIGNKIVIIMNKELFDVFTYISILINRKVVALSDVQKYFLTFDKEYQNLIKKSIISNIKNNGVNINSQENIDIYNECLSIINGTFDGEESFDKNGATLSVVYTLLPIANVSRLQNIKCLLKNK